MIGGLALAIGLLASYTVLNQMKAGTNTERMVQVVVAAVDIPIGTKLADRDLKLASFPQSSVPPGAFPRKSQVLGIGVVLPITRGDFILPNKLAPKDAGAGLQSMIPPGMRAVSVRVNDVVSVAGFVQPGTRVDVLATGSEGNQRQTTTVLENVAVAAVGKNLDPNSPDAQQAPVITFFVSPDDAQRLALASQEARIQLALRNPLDTKKGANSAALASSLYPGQAQPAATDTRPKPHKVVAKAAPPPPPSPYQVEMIRGSKRDETKFSDQNK